MFYCNACWTAQEQATQCVATSCGHLFCIPCAQAIVESPDSACRLCDNVITKGNIKLVKVEQERGQFTMQLFGQTPETALLSALAAIEFYNNQVQVVSDQQQRELNGRVKKVQEQCRLKLQEVHNGYLQAKKKYKELLGIKADLEADNKELVEKYAQKAQQARKLQDMVDRLQGAGGHRQLASAAGGRPLQPSNRHLGSAFQGGDGGHHVTTTIRKQAYYTANTPPPLMDDGSRPRSGHSFDAGGRAMGLLDRQAQDRRRSTSMSPLPSIQLDAAPRAETPDGNRSSLRKLLGGAAEDRGGHRDTLGFGVPPPRPRGGGGVMSGLASL